LFEEIGQELRVRRWHHRSVWLVCYLTLTPLLVAGQDQPDLSKFSIEDLMKVEVDTVYGASKFEQKVTEAPASVTILTDDDIQRYGYRTLAEALRSVPGIFVDYDRNFSYVGVRGFSRPGDFSSGILLLIDGHRTNDNVFDSPNFGTEFGLDVDNIRRIEIIRGPSSVLYGSNAFFAVINVITKRGRNATGVIISPAVGSLGTYEGRAGFGLDRLKGPEALLSASIFDSHGNERLFFPAFDSPKTNNGVAVDADRDKFYNDFISANYGEVSLQGLSHWHLKGVPTGPYGTVFNDPRTQTIDWESYLDLKYDRALASGWQVSGRAAYDRAGYDGTYVEDFAGQGIPPFTLTLDHVRSAWWTVEANAYRQVLKKHHVTLGTETQFNVKQNESRNNLSPPFEFFNIRASSNIPAFYVQDEFSISKELTLWGGVRYDHYAIFGGSTNPRFAVIYHPWEETSIKLIYGQASRVPSRYELLQAGNAALQPEVLKAPEIDLDHYFSKHWSGTLAAYYNLIDDLIIQEPGASASGFTNQGSVTTKGVELELSGKWPNGWGGRLGYTLQDSRNGNPNDPVNNYPKHLAKLNITAPLYRKKLFAGLEGQYTNERATLLGGEVGGYLLVNATLFAARVARGLDASLSAHNLLNRSYEAPGSVGLIENAIAQDGRTLRLKLTYRFGVRQ
jgi:outer membrane receptor for ferrienterochelin and colicins